MLNDTDMIEIRNLTDQRVVYIIPEKRVKRDFAPFESKIVEVGELRELYFKSGGAKLLQEYLGVKDKDLASEFGITEDQFTHEYSWEKSDIDNVLLQGSEDELADALDYAPRGIVETILDRAVALRIPNMNKRKLIKDVTGKDINKKIAYMELLDGEDETQPEKSYRRRVENKPAVGTGRRAK